jgi:hypothetical protein
VVAGATVYLPVDPVRRSIRMLRAAVVSAAVGGDVVVCPTWSCSTGDGAIASTAAVAIFMLVERIGTSLSRVPRTPTTYPRSFRFT